VGLTTLAQDLFDNGFQRHGAALPVLADDDSGRRRKGRVLLAPGPGSSSHHDKEPWMRAATSEHVTTGVDDVAYDLILVFQQALEDAHRYACFAADARSAGDDEVAGFFDELASSDREIAQRAKKLMVERLDT